MLESVKLVPEVPFDQLTVPAQPLAVRFKVAGEQTDEAVVKVMVGADGFAFTSPEIVQTLFVVMLVRAACPAQ